MRSPPTVAGLGGGYLRRARVAPSVESQRGGWPKLRHHPVGAGRLSCGGGRQEGVGGGRGSTASRLSRPHKDLREGRWAGASKRVRDPQDRRVGMFHVKHLSAGHVPSPDAQGQRMRPRVQAWEAPPRRLCLQPPFPAERTSRTRVRPTSLGRPEGDDLVAIPPLERAPSWEPWSALLDRFALPHRASRPYEDKVVPVKAQRGAGPDSRAAPGEPTHSGGRGSPFPRRRRPNHLRPSTGRRGYTLVIMDPLKDLTFAPCGALGGPVTTHGARGKREAASSSRGRPTPPDPGAASRDTGRRPTPAPCLPARPGRHGITISDNSTKPPSATGPSPIGDSNAASGT